MRDMKKFYLILLGVATLSFATLSCTKEAADPSQQEQSQKEENPKEDTTPENPTGEDDTPVPEGMVRLTFGVSHEGDAPATEPETEDSKTSWDGTTHAWSEGDQVRIIWGEGDSDYIDAVVVDGKVTATVADAEYYYAVYPTTATYALDLANGKLTITVPRYQTGSFSDANIMAAKTAKAAANLEFKNMTSIIKFTTGSTYSYNSVSFMANDQTKLTGTVATTFPPEFAVETANGSDAIVCIQKGNPSGNAGVSASNTFYLAMLPGAEITNGIGFKIEQRASETDLLGGAISKSAFARERSKIYDMGTLDDRIIKDWYISESGTGAGNDPMDPAGPARLMDLLNPAYSTNNTTAGWRLTGAIVHVAGGTYNLQALNGGEVFAPHYNLSNFVAHIKGEGDALNPTKFICNQTAATDHIIEISGSNKVGDFTFENITFTANPAASETNIDGVALSFTSSVASQLTFKDCVFTGITGSTGTANFNGGAAVNFNSEAAATILFDGCTFSNNTAARGGAVAFHNTDAKSDIQFKNCAFSNNIANSNQGGSVYVYANAAPVVFDGTSFTGDGSTNNAANGAAMCVVANGSVTIQNGCSFSNLVTSGNGGAIFNHGTVVIDNSSISNCKAKQGGAIYSDKTVEIRNGSTLTANDASTNGGAIYNAKDLSIDASTITGKGMGTDMTAELGGGIYNSKAGTVTITGGSVIEECALTGSNHHGAAIWNAGVLNIDGSTLRNNKNTQRGAAIYGANTDCAISLTNTVISGNEASNGAGIHLDDGAAAFLNGCTISGNTATNGSALRTANNSTTTKSKFIVFNTLISENTSGTSTGNQNGATVQATGYGRILLANCTIRKNTTPGTTAAITVNGANGKAYVVSCTMNENDADIRRTHASLEVHNSILMGLADDPLNVVREKSWWYGHLYGVNKDDKSDVAFALGSFDPSLGVYPLDSNYSTVYNSGMSASDIQALAFDNITLTDKQKALLGKDQKENSREGKTTMGAYVGE